MPLFRTSLYIVYLTIKTFEYIVCVINPYGHHQVMSLTEPVLHHTQGADTDVLHLPEQDQVRSCATGWTWTCTSCCAQSLMTGGYIKFIRMKWFRPVQLCQEWTHSPKKTKKPPPGRSEVYKLFHVGYEGEFIPTVAGTRLSRTYKQPHMITTTCCLWFEA